MFRNILVGADGSTTARRAVDAAVDIATMYAATVHIVSAYEPRHVQSSTSVEHPFIYSEGEVDALLQSLSYVASNRGLTPVLHSHRGEPADVLLRVAEDVDADLIVVGNRGMKGMRRVLGSTPNSVAHAAGSSVLIVDTVVE